MYTGSPILYIPYTLEKYWAESQNSVSQRAQIGESSLSPLVLFLLCDWKPTNQEFPHSFSCCCGSTIIITCIFFHLESKILKMELQSFYALCSIQFAYSFVFAWSGTIFVCKNAFSKIISLNWMFNFIINSVIYHSLDRIRIQMHIYFIMVVWRWFPFPCVFHVLGNLLLTLKKSFWLDQKKTQMNKGKPSSPCNCIPHTQDYFRNWWINEKVEWVPLFWLSLNIYFYLYIQCQLVTHRFIINSYFHQLT